MKNFLLIIITVLLLPLVVYGQEQEQEQEQLGQEQKQEQEQLGQEQEQELTILSDYQGRAKNELKKRGLKEAELRTRLLQKGIDLENIQPHQLGIIEKEIKTILEILTIEKRNLELSLENQDSLTIIGLDSLAQSKLDSFINAANGGLLKSYIYGHQIFRNGNIQPLNDSSFVKIPDSYILGAGDEITVSIFGASQFDAKFKIDQKGYIQPANMPKIFLKGLDWLTAKKLIQSRFNQFYRFRSDQFALSLVQPRKITVNIFGEVEKTGAYNLSAANTAFNALFAANGPTELGSVRHIKIINGSAQRELDIYELMNNPIKQFQFYLEDNAIIQVPVAQRIISITGAIQRPLKYELKETEGLQDLIKYAGGLTATAFQDIAQIRRYENGQPTLIDINLQQILADNQPYKLANGDSIIIKSVAKTIDNIVSISGAVELAGDYALSSTPRVSDLLNKGRLKKDAELTIAFLSRENSDGTSQLIQLDLNTILNQPGSNLDLLLAAKDKLLVNQASRYANATTISVKGAVRDNIEYPFDPDESITTQKAILLAGGLMPEATDFGYLIRINQRNSKDKSYVRVNIKAALENPTSAANIKLQPLDELVILTNANFTSVSTITTKGAVKFPSKYQFNPSLTLKDVLSLSGGLKQEAANNRIEIFRLVTDNNQPTQTIVITLSIDEQFNIIEGPNDFKLMPFDEIVVRSVPNFEKQIFVEITGEVLFPGAYALVKKNETLSDLIRRAGGLSSEAFSEGANVTRDDELVVTNLNQAINQQNSDANFVLKAGDIIDIPKKDDLVTILLKHTGAFEFYPNKFEENSKMGVPFTPNKSAKWYLDQYAAGFGANAVKANVTVQYANGAIKRSKKNGLFKSYPKLEKGATIAVGAKQAILEDENDRANKNRQSNYPKLKKGVIISLDKDNIIPKKQQLKEEKKSENLKN